MDARDVVGWAGLLASIWFLFEKADSVASPALKGRVTQWLKGANPREVLAGWLPTFVEVFDRLFGDRHFSWRCFSRSCVASIGAVLLVTLYWAISRPREALAIFTAGRPGNAFANYIFLTLMLSLFPDYASLLKSRGLIGWMNRRRTTTRLCLGVLLDLLGTLILVGLAFYVFFLLRVTLRFEMPAGIAFRVPLWLAAATMYSSYSLSAAPPGDFPTGIWPWATLFTAAWASLYALSSALLILARYLGLGFSRVRGVLNIEEKPIMALGVVAMAATTVVFIAAFLLRWITKG